MNWTPDQAREMGRRGGRARAAQCDMQALGAKGGQATVEKHGREHTARIGHRGALTTARRHGYATLFHAARAWRLENPSRHEQRVMAILADLGRTDYEREAMVLGEDVTIAVDFAFWSRRKAIEVNGKVHHDPLFDHPNAARTRAANDARRLEQVRMARWEVLVLDYRELDTARERIEEFLR